MSNVSLITHIKNENIPSVLEARYLVTHVLLCVPPLLSPRQTHDHEHRVNNFLT